MSEHLTMNLQKTIQVNASSGSGVEVVRPPPRRRLLRFGDSVLKSNHMDIEATKMEICKLLRQPQSTTNINVATVTGNEF